MRLMLKQLADKEVEMKIEAGRLELEADDIANLEAGDIIILEHHQLTLGPEGPGVLFLGTLALDATAN